MEGLNVNTQFDSFADLLAAKKAYETASNTVLVIGSSIKLKGSGNLVDLMKYYRLELCCKAGKERPTKSKGLRNVSTYKKNCKVKIKISYKDDKLKVTSANLNHEQHSTDIQTFRHYPENMKLTAEETATTITMVATDGNKQKIKHYLTKQRLDQGISSPISLKTIHNVQTKQRLEKQQLRDGECELEKLLDNMLKVYGALVRVVRDDNNDLLAIYFQDTRMRELFNKYPDVIFYDATYKTNNREMPVFVQTVIDGNGETEIVSIWVCKSESTVVAETMLDTFKEFNLSWENVKIIIGDKDFADRVVYSNKFPNAVLQICLFHVLQAFHREITTVKRDITNEQRLQVLETLQQLCYARSEEYYNEQYETLRSLQLEKVMEYFDTNWNCIRNEWTLYGRNKHSNYLNYTNNRTESMNQKLKMIGTRNANLLSFFENISTSIAVLGSEKDIKAVRLNMKVPRSRFDDQTLTYYQEFVTPFIFKKIHREYEKSNDVVFESCDDNKAITTYGTVVTNAECSCDFFKVMNLPCKHIFNFCQRNGLNSFLPHLCAERWTKQYYNASHPAINSSTYVPPLAPIYIQAVRTPLEKDKYKATANVTRDINSLMSTLPPDKFTYFLDELKRVKNTITESDLSTNELDENQDIREDDGVLQDLSLPDVTADGNIHGYGNQAREEAISSDRHNSFEQNTFVNESHLFGNKSQLVSSMTQLRAIPPLLSQNANALATNAAPPFVNCQQLPLIARESILQSTPQAFMNAAEMIRIQPQEMVNRLPTNTQQLDPNQYLYRKHQQLHLIPAWMPPFTASITNAAYPNNAVQIDKDTAIRNEIRNGSQLLTNGSQHLNNSSQAAYPSNAVQINTGTAIGNEIRNRSQLLTNGSEHLNNGSQLSMLTATSNQLKHIVLPTKNKSVGRPKGSVNTVIGTKRKATKEKIDSRKRTKIQPKNQPNLPLRQNRQAKEKANATRKAILENL